MANCDVNTATDLRNMTYHFNIDISISESEMQDLTLEYLKRLEMSLSNGAPVSIKLYVMAELFRQLGR